jgi:ring-1,2-phenylacetyl-CoA epoxidase subunit PaaD
VSTALAVAATVVDPELPQLTLADLGVLRDVSEEDGRLVVTITPTYTGCPAVAEMRADLTQALQAAGYADVDVRLALEPAWSTDDITPAGRAKLESTRTRLAPRRGAGAADPDPPRAGGRPAVRVVGHRGDQPLRPHAVHLPVAVQRLRRAVPARQGDLSR